MGGFSYNLGRGIQTQSTGETSSLNRPTDATCHSKQSVYQGQPKNHSRPSSPIIHLVHEIMLTPSYYHCTHSQPENSTPLLQHGGHKVTVSPRPCYLNYLTASLTLSHKGSRCPVTGKFKRIKSHFSAKSRHCISSLGSKGSSCG